MTNIVATIIGSGTLEQTRAILPAAQRGKEELGAGVRTGIQVIVANPEDSIAVDAFAVSGITVGTTPIEIIGPHTNPLPRCREIGIGNADTGTTVFIGHVNNAGLLIAEGIPLVVGASANSEPFGIRLPLLHNVSIYAVTETGTVDVKLLIL